MEQSRRERERSRPREERAKAGVEITQFGHDAARVLALQRAAGNHAVTGMVVAARQAGRRSSTTAARRLQRFAVAVKPTLERGNQWIIQSVVIDGRPPTRSMVGEPQHGGTSFHHETAWAIDEYNIAKKYEGQPVETTYSHLRRIGKAIRHVNSDDILSMVQALNEYFTSALTEASKTAAGWFGPATGHGAQGGDIAAKAGELRTALRQQNFEAAKRAAVYVFLSTYEEDPGLGNFRFFVHGARRAHMAKVQEFLLNSGLDESEITWASNIVSEYWGLQ